MPFVILCGRLAIKFAAPRIEERSVIMTVQTRTISRKQKSRMQETRNMNEVKRNGQSMLTSQRLPLYRNGCLRAYLRHKSSTQLFNRALLQALVRQQAKGLFPELAWSRKAAPNYYQSQSQHPCKTRRILGSVGSCTCMVENLSGRN